MKYFFEKFRFVLIILLILVAAAVSFIVTKNIYGAKIEKKQMEIDDLNLTLAARLDNCMVYRLKEKVKAGDACLLDNLELVEIPSSSFTKGMCDPDRSYDGLTYKIDFPAGTIIMEDMLTDIEISNLTRYMDVILDEMPIGLEVGDYIDIRIAFPLGQDYIVLPKKKVAQISGQTVKIICEEKDFYMIESCKTDMALFKATRLYASQYVEAGIQTAAEGYYPVTLEILKTMITDPNMTTGDFAETLEEREELEEQLMNSTYVEMAATVTQGKKDLKSIYQKAFEEYDRLQKEKEKQAAKELQN